MHDRGANRFVVTRGAVEDYFDGSDGAASGELFSSVIGRKDFSRRPVESLATNRTSYPRNACGANSTRVPQPANCKLFAAQRTGGEKLIVHRALSSPKLQCSPEVMSRAAPVESLGP